MIEELEKYIGFKIFKREVPLELNQPHNENFSYDLCQRFYGKTEEIKTAINKANKILNSPSKLDNEKQVEMLYSLTGNLYHLLGDFKYAAACFMKCLSYNKNDISPWIELLFSIRAMGEFELFEEAIFNFEKIYLLWQKDPDTEMTQRKFYELINLVKEKDQ